MRTRTPRRRLEEKFLRKAKREGGREGCADMYGRKSCSSSSPSESG